MACLRSNASLEIVGDNMTESYAFYENPLGQISLSASSSALTGLHFFRHFFRHCPVSPRNRRGR